MPGSIADTILDRDSIAIKELIGRNVVTMMPSTEPWFRDMILGATKAGVTVEGDFNSGLGRAMRMKKRFSGSLAGVIRGGQTSDFFTLAGDKTVDHADRHHFLEANQTWPDPMDGPVASTRGLTSTIYGVETNLAVSLSMMNLEATEANIKEHINPLITGFAKNIALFFANSWHADPANQYRLCGLGPSAGDLAYSIDAANYRITFTPSNRCVHKFAPGMSVDLYKDATTRANLVAAGGRAKLTVADFDPWSGVVILQAESDNFAVWATTANLTSAAYVKYADTYDSTLGHRGFYAWKNFAVWGGAANADNYILRDQAITDTVNDYLDIRKYSEFRSGYQPNVGTLTERKLGNYLENAQGAMFPYGYSFDTGIFAPGIVNNVFESYQARENFDRGATPGAPVVMRTLGLGSGFRVQYEDLVYDIFVSRFMDDGLGTFFKRKGNWALITPPTAPGVLQNGVVNDEELDPIIPLEFPMSALGGSGNAWMGYSKVVNNAVLPTEYKMLPGMIRAQMMPTTQIPMLVLSGINSSRVYSEKVTS